jgi:hypothetical protein
MSRKVIDYANPRSSGSTDGVPIRGSLALVSFRLAVVIAIGQAMIIGVVLRGHFGALDIVVGLATAFVGFAVVVLWMIAVAFGLIAWKDRDGPRRVVARALVLLSAEVVVVWSFFKFLVR